MTELEYKITGNEIIPLTNTLIDFGTFMVKYVAIKKYVTKDLAEQFNSSEKIRVITYTQNEKNIVTFSTEAYEEISTVVLQNIKKQDPPKDDLILMS